MSKLNKELLERITGRDQEAILKVQEFGRAMQRLKSDVAYDKLLEAVSIMYHGAANANLEEDGSRSLYWKGIREGIKLMVDVIDGGIARYVETLDVQDYAEQNSDDTVPQGDMFPGIGFSQL